MQTGTRRHQILDAARRALTESRKMIAEEDAMFNECDAELARKNRQISLLQRVSSALHGLHDFLAWISVNAPEEIGRDDANRSAPAAVPPPEALRCVAHVFCVLFANHFYSADAVDSSVDATWAYLAQLADVQSTCAEHKRDVARLRSTVEALEEIPQKCRVSIEALESALRALEEAGETVTTLLIERDRETEANMERVERIKKLEDTLHSIVLQADTAEETLQNQRNTSNVKTSETCEGNSAESGLSHETAGSLLSMQRLVNASGEIANLLESIAEAKRALLPQASDDEPFTLFIDEASRSVVVAQAHSESHAANSPTQSPAYLTEFLRAFYARRRAGEKCALLEKEKHELERGLKKLDALVELQNTLSLLASTHLQKDAAMAELAALPSPDAIRQLVLPSLRGQVRRLCEELDARLSSIEATGQRRSSQSAAEGGVVDGQPSPRHLDNQQTVLEKQQERNAKLRNLLITKRIDAGRWEREEKPRHETHIANLEQEHANLKRKVANLGASLTETVGILSPEKPVSEVVAVAAGPEVLPAVNVMSESTPSDANSSSTPPSVPAVGAGLTEVEVEILQGGTVRRVRISVPAARPLLRKTAGSRPMTRNSLLQLQSESSATYSRANSGDGGMPRFMPSKLITSVLRIIAPGDPVPAKVERALEI